MKRIHSFIFLLLASVALCRAQDEEVISTNLPWLSVDAILELGLTNGVADDGTPVMHILANFESNIPPTPPAIAEVITPDIQALADGLQDDPVKIFNYVHDHIRHMLYFGSKKGAQLTLLEKSGNDFDQCALLVALLRAAGYNDAGYQFGWMLIPYDNTDGSHRDIHHWLDLDLTNSDWSTTTGYLDELFRNQRSYPITAHNWGNNIYGIQRVWVTVTVGGTNYALDPAFKVTERIPGIDLQTAMGFSASGLTNAAGGFATSLYVTNLNEAALASELTGYTKNLLNYIQANYPNASVEQILSGECIVLSTNLSLSGNLPFAPTNWNGAMPVIDWVNQPTNMMATFAISFLGTNYQWFSPQLHGDRVSLTVSSSGSAQLWQEDTNLATKSTGGGSGTFDVTLTTYYPGFQSGWNTNLNVLIPGNPGQPWEASTKGYQKANASYAIMYSYEPDWGWLKARQRKLDAYQAQGLSDTSRQIVTETLNIMGLNWQIQLEFVQRALARKIGALPNFYHRLGRMSQESGFGYYVDVYQATTAAMSSSGLNDNHKVRWLDVSTYFGSAMEHGLIEQMQSSNLVGASTIKILQLANAGHKAIFLANGTNWSAISPLLTNYSAGSLSSIASLVSGGNAVLLPQNGKTAINGSGSWTGYGLLAHFPSGGVSMAIGDSAGVHNGGYVSDLNATIDTSWINYSAYSQPIYFSASPVSIPTITAADPVDMANGTFQVETTDLSLGETEPRGLSFSRYYSSSRRNSNLTGISPGWMHNYYFNAATVSSPEAGLGGTTPAQMAAMTVAMTAVNSCYDGDHPEPKNWMTTALIIKWGIDQLTGKAASVSLGNDTIQFIQQPDGTYTPPANCTMTLSRTNGAYWLQERHGRTFKFNSAGWATNIVDQYGQPMKLAYNSSNWVTTATDWKGRTLTFTYSSSTPKRLTIVADSTGRDINLAYSTAGDLNAVTDPDNNTSKFNYDTNHQIVATFNARTQLVVSNIYNGFGRVTKQFTQGDTNKTWRIFWSGWETTSQDPAGGRHTYFYDDKTRLVAERDGLGNLTRKYYDGQDHVIATVSPLGETHQFVYGGNHNLTQIVDPLGFSSQFFYDSQYNVIRATDARGNPTTFGYNAQFSITGQTNGAGDFVNYGYFADGNIQTVTDAAGTTTAGYDSYGLLNSITFTNGLGNESFGNNALGDVTNYVDARGFTTSFQYNLRRQLVKTTAPTNLVTQVAYDADGNVVSTTDARGVSTTNLWSATGKLLSIKLPNTPLGFPIVSNVYDNRDLLVRTIDPLQNAMQFTNDIAGRLVAATDPLLQTTKIQYNANGQTIATTNAVGEGISQEWDARGKLTKLIEPSGHSVLHGYDEAGNQVALTNRNGKVWHFYFDGANRLTNTVSPLGYKVGVTFNHQGSLSSLTDGGGHATTFNYDTKGRLASRIDSVGTTTYVADLNGNITNLIENSLTNAWTYDAYNRPASYRDSFGNVIQYRYDLNGNVTNLIYPNGKGILYAFDGNNRLTNITDWSGRKTRITYDLAGHLTSIKYPNGAQRAIGYDTAGQLTNILETATNGLPIAWFRFGWDGAQRAQWEFATPIPHVPTVETRTMSYDDDNRLATFNGSTVNNDASGNIVFAPLTNNTFVSYGFDARNRLSTVGGVTSSYDPAGNRVTTSYGTNSEFYLVNPNTALPQVLMRIKNGVTNYYVYGVGLLYEIAETAARTNTRTYTYDYRGSTVALSDDRGNVTDRIEYSAYGLTTYRVGTTDTPFLFNGKYGVQADPNGLLFMRSRFYNPYLCRFINADPSGFSGGLNFYAYANGNPVSLIDPFGFGAVSDAIAAASWFNAPTPEQIQIEGFLTDFVNIVTLGTANLVATAATGEDLYGNKVSGVERGIAIAQTAMMVIPWGRVAGLAADVSEYGATLATKTVRFSSGAGTGFGEGSQALLNETVFGDAALSNVRLGTSPIYDPSLPYYGEFSASGMNNFGVKIGPQAFSSRTELVGTIIHEETHLRFFQRLNAGGVRAQAIDAMGMEEDYVRAIEARFLRMKGLTP